MKFSNLMMISAIVMLILGLALFLVPGTFLSLYMAVVTPETEAVGRLFGAVLIGWGALDWLVRPTRKSEARDAVAMSKLITWIVALVAALWVQLSGMFNSFGWAIVLMDLLFALAWAYLIFMKQEEPQGTAAAGD